MHSLSKCVHLVEWFTNTAAVYESVCCLIYFKGYYYFGLIDNTMART